jgi:ribosomal protein L35AE/L33A
MEQAANGTLPQVVSYSRCKKSLEPCSVVIEPKNVSENDALVVLFDNTFSWLKEKSVR